VQVNKTALNTKQLEHERVMCPPARTCGGADRR
jgi:hypothetical protein